MVKSQRSHLFSLIPSQKCHHASNAKDTNTIPKMVKTSPVGVLSVAAELGNSFCSVAVAPSLADVQLATPQSYPDGQHPATGPALSGHMYQPPAHVLLSSLPRLGVGSGTATVTPLEMMVVDRGGAGQLVVWQSRPVWQQPPPARATHG